MKLAVMQPYFFPYLGYFQLFHAADKVILYDNVKFIKSGWIHRNRILEIGKGPRFIGLPLEKASTNNRIKDVKIDVTKDWKTPIMHMLRHNYCRSPYYCEVKDIVDAALDLKEASISGLAKSSINAVLAYLDISTPVDYDSTRFDSLENDLDSLAFLPSSTAPFHRLKQKRMTYRVKALCDAENANTYINPIGGISS
ncbi:MAG TPA: WbqC family protein, partial [Rectinemataceae bacterium]|nr:WbqC family protein [Rectinemataceae bacterium]